MRCCSGRWSTRRGLHSTLLTTSAPSTGLRRPRCATSLARPCFQTCWKGGEKISNELQKIIDVRTEPWGVNVISVEVKDVLIPSALEDAMSMQAQAERERQARVILGDSERQVAEKFGEAAKTYADNPTAFHLRAMNMLYEGLKGNNATIVIVPSTAVETMQLGGLAAVTALTSTLGQQDRTPEPWSGPALVKPS
jgi:regulator of protease activity HflC (stomatin/prohibitin superfamily)